MIDMIVNTFDTMSLLETLHTIGFSLFMVGGALAFFLGADPTARAKMPTPAT